MNVVYYIGAKIQVCCKYHTKGIVSSHDERGTHTEAISETFVSFYEGQYP